MQIDTDLLPPFWGQKSGRGICGCTADCFLSRPILLPESCHRPQGNTHQTCGEGRSVLTERTAKRRSLATRLQTGFVTMATFVSNRNAITTFRPVQPYPHCAAVVNGSGPTEATWSLVVGGSLWSWGCYCSYYQKHVFPRVPSSDTWAECQSKSHVIVDGQTWCRRF
jgi:hypothetical protein